MEVTQTKAEGLSRIFEIKVPASELQAKLDARIEEIRPQMRLKGFRPGKVPASHVRQMYGKSIMGEVVEALVSETNQKALDDAELRPASSPEFEMKSEMEAVLGGSADLDYEMQVEIMPDFEPADIKSLKLDRPIAEIPDEEIQESLDNIAEQNKKYEPREEGTAAEEGDAVVIDFVGKIDDEAFEGGTAEGHTLVLGSGQFIPGFEDQLIGAKAGEERAVNVSFPEQYQAEHLAGKEAVFDVTINEVREPQISEINDDFAKGLGVEDLETLKGMLSDQIKVQYDAASRSKAKRALLDALDEAHSFDLPPKMVELEFNQIWSQFEQEKEAGRLDEEEAQKPEDELKEEYRSIAERRVRLGLVLAEIGRVNDVKITEAEVQQALVAEARKFPGQEREVLEFFQKNPNASAQLRAPIYEDKVVDFILEEADINEVTVSKDDLFKEDEV